MPPEQFMGVVDFALKCLQESDIDSAIVALSVIQAIATQKQPPKEKPKLRVL